LAKPIHKSRPRHRESMTESYVERQDLPVLRVKVDWNTGGPAAAMAMLESRLTTLKGRKFYGCFRVKPEGEDYYACVARVDSDDPGKMKLEAGVIPGGWYARRRLVDWAKDLSQMGKIFQEMSRDIDVDPERPSLEFYRSETEVLLFVPVLGIPKSIPQGRQD
jgi:hypothetical protein